MYKRVTVGDLMYLYVVSVCQEVGANVPLHGVLFHVVSKSSNDGVAVAFHLIIGLWVVRRGNDVFTP